MKEIKTFEQLISKRKELKLELEEVETKLKEYKEALEKLTNPESIIRAKRMAVKG